MGLSTHLLFFLHAGETQLIYRLSGPSPSKPEDRPRTPKCVCILMPLHCLLAQLLVRPVTTGFVCCTPSRPPVRTNTHTHPDQWRRRAWYRASGLRAIGAGFPARIGQGKPLLWHAFLVAEKAAAKTRVKLMEKKAATEDKRRQEQKYDDIYIETKRRRMSTLMLSELTRRAEEEDLEPSSSARRSGEHEQGDSGGGSSSGLVRNPNRAHCDESASLPAPDSSPSSGRRLTHPMSLPTMRPATVTPETDSSDESTHDAAG
jgi:hypothetical protein